MLDSWWKMFYVVYWVLVCVVLVFALVMNVGKPFMVLPDEVNAEVVGWQPSGRFSSVWDVLPVPLGVSMCLFLVLESCRRGSSG